MNTSRQTGRVRLENVRRRRAIHWDVDVTILIYRDSELRLRSGKRHRDTFLANEEWLVGQIPRPAKRSASLEAMASRDEPSA